MFVVSTPIFLYLFLLPFSLGQTSTKVRVSYSTAIIQQLSLPLISSLNKTVAAKQKGSKDIHLRKNLRYQEVNTPKRNQEVTKHTFFFLRGQAIFVPRTGQTLNFYCPPEYVCGFSNAEICTLNPETKLRLCETATLWTI